MQDTVLRTMEWLAQAADNPQRCIDEWDLAPQIPQPLAIGKTFDLVTVHSRVGRRVLEMYDRDHIAAGGAVLDTRVLKMGFLVHRNPAVPPPLTIALACDAVYQTRSSGRKGYLLVNAPMESGVVRSDWLRIPGVGGTYTFSLGALTHKLAEVAREGVAFPVDDVPPPAPSYL